MLAEEKCTACHAGAPKVAQEEAEELLKEIPGWEIKQFDGENHLVKRFEFDDFATALDFTIKVGELAEEAGHHPTLITAWGKVSIHWWTHKIRDLHRNDFIMAGRTDNLFKNLTSVS